MVTANATVLHKWLENNDTFIRHFPSLRNKPSWLSVLDEEVVVSRTSDGYLTRWFAETATRKSVSTERPNSVSLARLSSLCDFSKAHCPDEDVCLCVATSEIVHIVASTGTTFQCPLPRGAARRSEFRNLFSSPYGILVEMQRRDSAHVSYCSLVTPFQELSLLQSVPQDHRVVFSSLDIPIIITQGPNEWILWEVSAGLQRIDDDQDKHDAANIEISPVLQQPQCCWQRGTGPSARSTICRNESVDKIDPIVPRKLPELLTFGENIGPDERRCLVLHKLLSVPITVSAKNAFCCLNHDVTGDLLLSVCVSRTLTSLSIQVNDRTTDEGVTVSAVVKFHLPDVVAAVGVLASRRNEGAVDTLIVNSSNMVSLYLGQHQLCGVSIQVGSDGPLMESHAGIVELRDGVGGRATAVHGDGTCVRFSITDLVPSCPLVTECISCVTWACSDICPDQNPTVDIRRAILRDLVLSDSPAVLQDEWNIFVRSLMSLLSFRKFEFTWRPAAESARTGTSEDSSNDWMFLQLSSRHNTHVIGNWSPWHPTAVSVRCTVFGSADIEMGHNLIAEKHILRIVETLHLLYESKKLNTSTICEQRKLAFCNALISVNIGRLDHLDAYLRDFAELCCLFPRPIHAEPSRAGAFSIFDWLARRIRGQTSYSDFSNRNLSSSLVGSFDYVGSLPLSSVSRLGTAVFIQHSHLQPFWISKSPLSLLDQVMRYYILLFDPCSLATEKQTAISPRLRVLHAMSEDGFTVRDLDSLPFGVALPLRDAIWSCKKTPGKNLPMSAELLIGREDLWTSPHEFAEKYSTRNNFQTCTENNVQLPVSSRVPDHTNISAYCALLRIQAAATTFSDGGLVNVLGSYQDSEAKTNDCTQAKKHGKHGRRKEAVKREASSSSAREVNEGCAESHEDPGDGCDVNDDIFLHRFGQDRRLSEVRRLLRSTEPVTIKIKASATAAEDGSELDRANEQQMKLAVLLRRYLAAPVGRGAFTLRTVTPSDPTSLLPIPKLSLVGKIHGQKGARVCFKPEGALYAPDWGEFHNGVAAGLRLVASDSDGDQDYRHILTRTWIVNHRPFDSTGNCAHAGMLLSLGLGGYLPALRATDYYEYLVPMHDLTSIGLMLGLSAGNRGSFHAKITKMLCVHIRHFNTPGFTASDFHVSMNVQTAAVLGLGLLYEGTCEHVIVEGLFSELVRRAQPGDVVKDREGLSLAAGFGLGFTLLGVGNSAPALADLNLVDSLIQFAMGGLEPGAQSANGIAVGGSGTFVNTHHQGSYKKARNKIGVPPISADSETSRVKESEFVNTDVTAPGALMALALIFLKSNDMNIARRIILPDTVYALDRARPDHVYLRALAKHLIMWDSMKPETSWVLSTLPPLIRPPPTESSGIDLHTLWLDVHGENPEVDVDERGILFARAFAVTAACTALSLRFAGLAEKRVMTLIFDVATRLERSLLGHSYGDEESEWVYSTCMNMSALALSIAAAGSGDLSVFKLLRRFRKRSGPSLRKNRYGSHMAVHMAIGFLFLGSGCQTFGTSNIAVGGLLCSIYPRFPSDVDDNQYHLQAFRHLYVLAVEPRCLEARDVETDQPCYVSLQLKMKGSNVFESRALTLRAPCLIPDSRLIDSVSVVSERYLPKSVDVPVAMDGSGWFSPTKRLIVYVKRRAGHLPYSVDPSGSKGMLARSFGRVRQGEGSQYGLAHMVRAFSADPNMLAFVRHFLDSDRSLGDSPDRSDFHSETLYECLSLDKPEAVQRYLEIDRAVGSLKAGKPCPATVGSFVLLGEYASATPPHEQCLIRRDFLCSVVGHVRASFSVDCRGIMSMYVKSAGREWPSENVALKNRSLGDELLGMALQLYQIPRPGDLQNLACCLRSAAGQANDLWFTVGSCLAADTPECAIELIVRCLEK